MLQASYCWASSHGASQCSCLSPRSSGSERVLQPSHGDPARGPHPCLPSEGPQSVCPQGRMLLPTSRSGPFKSTVPAAAPPHPRAASRLVPGLAGVGWGWGACPAPSSFLVDGILSRSPTLPLHSAAQLAKHRDWGSQPGSTRPRHQRSTQVPGTALPWPRLQARRLTSQVSGEPHAARWALDCG